MTRQTFDSIIATDDDAVGIAIVASNTQIHGGRRWWLATGEWSQPTEQTARSWPDGTLIFKALAEAEDYAQNHLPIEPGQYGYYRFELIGRRDGEGVLRLNSRPGKSA